MPPHVAASAAGSYAASAASTTPSSPISDVENSHHHPFDPLLGRSLSSINNEAVFPLLQRVRHEIASVIDTPLTYEQLKTPSINFSIVRPLTIKLSKGERPAASLIYCLLINRQQFLNEAEADLAFCGVNTTRADLCELLALKLLSAFGTSSGNLELLHVLTASFNPFMGATEEMFVEDEGLVGDELEEIKEWGKASAANALELAIFSKAKRFVKSPLVQQAVKGIYVGDVTYQPEGAHSLIQDDYKRKPVIELYDWRKQPFLDHYRLRVPLIRNRLEFFTFSAMLVLFLITQTTRDDERVNIWEGLFIFWSLGFALDEFASMQENGITAYYYGVYNVLDSLFCFVFFTFLGLRIQGLLTHDLELSELAFDTLALAACILFPRLSISLIRGNVVLLALSAMIKEFVLFMGLASLTASGFLVALHVLARGTWDVGQIAWLMFKIWLGNSFLGFEAAQKFHPVLGPFLIVLYALLSQTLLLTILISLLSNTFAAVQANAETEILNQKALRTIERVKSDALTSYMPPLNVVAFLILLPLRFLLTPRYFHKTNVLLTKTFNLPILLFLALHTRFHHKGSYGPTATKISLQTQRAWASLPRGIPWDGAVETVGRIFEREVTPVAIAVPSIDAEEEGGKEGVDKRLKALAEGVQRGRSQHARMGSLASPLAKMFTLQSAVELSAEAEKGKKADKAKAAQVEMSKGLEERLAGIEKALELLVGELGRNGVEAKEVVRPPLTSLTGQMEQSYTSDGDE